MKFHGHIVRFGDGVNTDLLFPSEAIVSMSTVDPADYEERLREYGMKNLDVDRERLDRATILVAGGGLGAGSSRQYAADILRVHGLSGVIADSIHPVFFRNLWNVGLFAVEVPGIAGTTRPADTLSVDLSLGMIERPADGTTWSWERPISPFLLEMLAAGGLRKLWRQRQAERVRSAR